MNFSILVPLRTTEAQGNIFDGLAAELEELSRPDLEVVVVDGSDSDIFETHSRRAVGVILHPVDRSTFSYLNDKINGIFTGVSLARGDVLLIMDDDIRPTQAQVVEICSEITDETLVKVLAVWAYVPPYLLPEVGRAAIANALYRPGDVTNIFGVRRIAMSELSHDFPGDVLFDNWQLESHLTARGFVPVVSSAVVSRLPPSFKKAAEQQIRYAYEDLAFWWRSVASLFLLPLTFLAIVRLRTCVLIVVLVTATILIGVIATWGSRRPQMRGLYRWWQCVVGALAWVPVRSVSVYLALVLRLTTGYRFGPNRIRRPALRELPLTGPSSLRSWRLK